MWRLASDLVGARRAWLGAALDRLSLLDYFIKLVYVIEPFEIVRAVILIVVTVGISYLIGVSSRSCGTEFTASGGQARRLAEARCHDDLIFLLVIQFFWM